MGAALSLRGFRLKLYNPPPPRPIMKIPSLLKIGDIVEVNKANHELDGLQAKVISTYGDLIEVIHCEKRRFFKRGELRWLRFSKI